MIAAPAVRPSTPGTIPAQRTVEVRSHDGALHRMATPDQAAAIVARGAGEWHRGYVRLVASVDAARLDLYHGGRRTWYGPLHPGVDGRTRYSHADAVCAGYRRADISEHQA